MQSTNELSLWHSRYICTLWLTQLAAATAAKGTNRWRRVEEVRSRAFRNPAQHSSSTFQTPWARLFIRTDNANNLYTAHFLVDSDKLEKNKHSYYLLYGE
jgi:hypothetical protein